MNVTEILQDFFTGNPLIDSMIVGIMFTVFITFYGCLFSAVFSMFKK